MQPSEHESSTQRQVQHTLPLVARPWSIFADGMGSNKQVQNTDVCHLIIPCNLKSDFRLPPGRSVLVCRLRAWVVPSLQEPRGYRRDTGVEPRPAGIPVA